MKSRSPFPQKKSIKQSYFSPNNPPTQKKDNTSIKIKPMINPKKINFGPTANKSLNLDNILEDSARAARNRANAVSEEEYYNPEVEEGITSGDWRQDLLYNNQYLMDLPIIGKIIKDKIKSMASKSEGAQYMSTEDVEKLKEDEKKALAKGEKVKNNYTGARNWKGLKAGVNLLDQYFSEEPLLEEAKYKPKDGYYPFLKTYSARSKGWEDSVDEKGKEAWADSARDLINQEIQSTLQDQFFKEGMDKNDGYNWEANNESQLMWEKFKKNKKTIFTRRNEGSRAADAMNVDLGGHSIGIAYDEESGYPYLSVADAWDFEPRNYTKKWGDDDNEESRQLAKIQSTLMHKAGNPYKLYDRFYINPDTGKYMTTKEMENLSLKKKSI